MTVELTGTRWRNGAPPPDRRGRSGNRDRAASGPLAV